MSISLSFEYKSFLLIFDILNKEDLLHISLLTIPYSSIHKALCFVVTCSCLLPIHNGINVSDVNTYFIVMLHCIVGESPFPCYSTGIPCSYEAITSLILRVLHEELGPNVTFSR